MSQKAVESVIGRLVTDVQFRQMASLSLAEACFKIGLELTPTELELLSHLKIDCFFEICHCIDPGLRRVG